MQQLPTLYARSNTGAILEWQIEVSNGQYRMITGQQNGKKTTSFWTTAKVKNEGRANVTDVNEQAYKEALACWKKKVKLGYCENINDIDIEKFFEPMLAKEFPKCKDKLKYPVLVQPKLNGVRCIIKKDGAFSRRGERFYLIPHIIDSLAPLFAKNPNMVLDGELYNYQMRNNLGKTAGSVSVVSKAKDVTPEKLKQSRDFVQYHIYDGFGFNDPKNWAPIEENHTCASRYHALDNLLQALGDGTTMYNYIYLTTTELAHTEQEVDKIYINYVQDSMEGAIVRNPNAPYQRKRTKDLLKYKNFIEEDFLFKEFEEGTGNWANTAKVIVFYLNKPGTNGELTFKCNIKGGTMELLAEWWKNPDQFKGKKGTVRFQEYSPYGIPLIPQFQLWRDYE